MTSQQINAALNRAFRANGFSTVAAFVKHHNLDIAAEHIARFIHSDRHRGRKNQFVWNHKHASLLFVMTWALNIKKDKAVEMLQSIGDVTYYKILKGEKPCVYLDGYVAAANNNLVESAKRLPVKSAAKSLMSEEKPIASSTSTKGHNLSKVLAVKKTQKPS